MSSRQTLLGLIALATIGFLVGTTIERNSGESRHESAATLRAEGKATENGSESTRTLAAEAAATSKIAPAGGSTDSRAEATRGSGESKGVHAAETSGKTTAERGGERGGESHASPAPEKTTARSERTLNKKTTHTET